MIIHEDPFFEEAAMNGDFDVIVPVSIFVPSNGDEPLFTAYNSVWDICEAYEADNRDDLMNPDALAKLCRDITPAIREMGYDVDLKGSRVILEYRINSTNESVEKYAQHAVIIRSYEEIRELECPLLHVPDPEDGNVCSVVIENGVVCSSADINDYSDDDSVEINIETASAYRGKGYGTIATAGLIRHLLNDGNTVAYNCAEKNISSSAIAKKLGMTLQGKSFNIICYEGEITEK